MEKQMGLYVVLRADGTLERTLCSRKGEKKLPDTTLDNELITYSELNFGAYPEWLEMIDQLSAEVENDDPDHFGEVDMEKFLQLLHLTEDLVLVLEKSNLVTGTLMRTLIEDKVPKDDGTAWYVYVAKTEIQNCLEGIMRFQMFVNRVLSVFANKEEFDVSNYPYLRQLHVTQIVNLDTDISTEYFFRSEVAYYQFLLMHLISRKPNVAFCHCCGRFFIPKTRKKTLYCDRVLVDDKTCKDMAPYLKHKKAAANIKVIQEFDRAKQRMYRRYERTDSGKEKSANDLTYNEYYDWLDEATKARDQFLRGEISEEDALTKIIVP